MDYFWIFILGLILSFVGSIPPGTLNVTVFQLSLAKRIGTAFRFAVAVSIVDYPYAWIGVNFQNLLLPTDLNNQTFKLVTAAMMIIVGLSGFRSRKPPKGIVKKVSDSGFRKGLIMSFLNPMAIPYWAAVSAYCKMQNWLQLSSQLQINIFIIGACVGSMIYLTTLIFLANRLPAKAQESQVIKIFPKVVLITIGLYMLWGVYLHSGN